MQRLSGISKYQPALLMQAANAYIRWLPLSHTQVNVLSIAVEELLTSHCESRS